MHQIQSPAAAPQVDHGPARVIDLTAVCGEEISVRPTVYTRLAKPAGDRVLALLVLAVTWPLLLLAVLVVLVSLGRPILLRQTRIGHHGQPFTVYKLRTMAPDRRRVQMDYIGPDRRRSHKRPDDPRISRGGRFLRRFSLDELPQLLNVMRGEMSLVGPRPELPSIVAGHYTTWHHQRHLVKPGLTGLWQVSERGTTVMHERVELDLEYIRRLGPLTDLRILLRTVPAAVMTQQGV